jgi:hypothetical protein
MGETRSATAAPGRLANAKVTVVDENRRGIADAKVQIWGECEGPTKKNGLYTSPPFHDSTRWS